MKMLMLILLAIYFKIDY